MTLEQHKKVAENTMRLLKVRYVSYLLAKTEKGDIWVKFTKDQDNYDLILDAVPLDLKDFNNSQFKKLVEKYWFEQPSGLVGAAGISNKQLKDMLNVDDIDEIPQEKVDQIAVHNEIDKIVEAGPEALVETPAQVEQPAGDVGVPTEENKLVPPAVVQVAMDIVENAVEKANEPNTPHEH